MEFKIEGKDRNLFVEGNVSASAFSLLFRVPAPMIHLKIAILLLLYWPRPLDINEKNICPSPPPKKQSIP